MFHTISLFVPAPANSTEIFNGNSGNTSIGKRFLYFEYADFEQSPDREGLQSTEAALESRSSPSFAALVQSFFTEYLTQQRTLSPQTVAAYRDAFVLFLDFAVVSLHKQPATLSLQDITPVLILDFLAHLERDRGNFVRTRNARLAALRAFLKFASHRDVGALRVVEQALGVPMKRFERPMLGYLSREEILVLTVIEN